MRIALLALASALLASAVDAQAAPATAPVTIKIYAGSAEVTALIAKAKADRKPGQGIVSEPLLLLAPYRASLEDRTLPTAGVVHPQHAELM